LDLSTFNLPQRAAITHGEGPLLVLAGAGSGKTRVITYRIAYLVAERKIKPCSIMAVTFTNKAANEMKERLTGIMKKECPEADVLPHVSTFHSFCARVLRDEIDLLGFRRSFTILDTDDCKKIIIDSTNACDLDPKKYKHDAIASIIDKAKNEGLFPDEVPPQMDYFYTNCIRVYREYQKRLKVMNALDFGDLIMFVLKIFRTCPDVLAKYHKKFEWFLVDETQDTNKVQFDLIKLLAKKTSNICVVGDDDQSIYGWRGARLDNILKLEKDFPGLKTIKMEQNYRCTRTILEAANAVIANNQGRMGKVLFTENESGDPISVVMAETEKHEGLHIANEVIRGKKEDRRKFSDYAVLYRVNSLSRSVEEALLRNGIPYTIVGGLKFYDRAEIKDALAYLRLIANPDDDMALRRIINTPARGIGKTTIDRLAHDAAKRGISMLEAIPEFRTPGKTKDAAAEKLQAFARLMDNIREWGSKASLPEFVDRVLKASGYFAMLENENTEQSENRIENLREFVSVAADFVKDEAGGVVGTAAEHLEAFLERVALISSMDSENKQDRVTLMTMHAAKGLEFPVVFVVGAEDGLFPHARAFEAKTEMEEERRLAYVAITRAKEELQLCLTEWRTVYGKTENRSPSMFISEIPSDCVEYRRSEK